MLNTAVDAPSSARSAGLTRLWRRPVGLACQPSFGACSNLGTGAGRTFGWRRCAWPGDATLAASPAVGIGELGNEHRLDRDRVRHNGSGSAAVVRRKSGQQIACGNASNALRFGCGRVSKPWSTTDDARKGAPIHVIELQPTPHGVRAARKFAAEVLDDHDVRVRETAVLLVSELVSNAVQHGGPHDPTSTVGLEVQASPKLVRVKVTDAGPGDPTPGDGAIDHPSGRGLLLVEALASRWGCDRLPVGKTVWFEIPTPSGGDADG